MKRHFKLILATIIIALSGIIAYGLYFYFKPMRKVSQQQTDYKMTGNQLLDEFSKSSAKGNIRYLDKILELSGNIKKTEVQNNANNVIFDNGGTIIIVAACLPEEKNKVTQLSPGNTVTLKGIYKGFIKGDDLFEMPAEIKIDQCTVIK